jgi:hypothetical protein
MRKKRSKIYVLLLLTLIITSCVQTEKQSEKQVENMLEELSGLVTVEYVVSKIVKASDNATWYKFGDRKILFTCKASLKAGIDLSDLHRDSIHVDAMQKSVSLVLPKANLLSFNMKPADIHLVYEKTAITRFPFSNAERNIIMVQGEKNIRESVDEFGILTEAENNAKMFLETFLKQAGYEKINIKFSKN